MAIKAYATAVDPKKVSSVEVGDKKFLTTLGSEDNIAVQLQELFESVTESITASLEVESSLTIEISGSISLKAQGGAKYLFFNVGAEASTTGTMKVTLSTKVTPKVELKSETKQTPAKNP